MLVHENPPPGPCGGAAPQGDGAAGATVTFTRAGGRAIKSDGRGSSQSSSQICQSQRGFFLKMITKL